MGPPINPRFSTGPAVNLMLTYFHNGMWNRIYGNGSEDLDPVAMLMSKEYPDTPIVVNYLDGTVYSQFEKGIKVFP